MHLPFRVLEPPTAAKNRDDVQDPIPVGSDDESQDGEDNEPPAISSGCQSRAGPRAQVSEADKHGSSGAARTIEVSKALVPGINFGNRSISVQKKHKAFENEMVYKEEDI